MLVFKLNFSMNKAQVASLLLLMVSISGITFYTYNNHTAILNSNEEKHMYA